MTPIERQLLINQFKILALLDQENSHDYLQKVTVLESGHISLYEAVFSGREETSSAIEEETHDILSMFRHIENAVAALPNEQQGQFSFAFKGFDANNDSHYSFAKFLIEEQGLYNEHAGKYLNSHSRSTLMQYRNMLTRYTALTAQGHDLGLSELQQLAAA